MANNARMSDNEMFRDLVDVWHFPSTYVQRVRDVLESCSLPFRYAHDVIDISNCRVVLLRDAVKFITAVEKHNLSEKPERMLINIVKFSQVDIDDLDKIVGFHKMHDLSMRKSYDFLFKAKEFNISDKRMNELRSKVEHDVESEIYAKANQIKNELIKGRCISKLNDMDNFCMLLRAEVKGMAAFQIEFSEKSQQKIGVLKKEVEKGSCRQSRYDIVVENAFMSELKKEIFLEIVFNGSRASKLKSIAEDVKSPHDVYYLHLESVPLYEESCVKAKRIIYISHCGKEGHVSYIKNCGEVIVSGVGTKHPHGSSRKHDLDDGLSDIDSSIDALQRVTTNIEGKLSQDVESEAVDVKRMAVEEPEMNLGGNTTAMETMTGLPVLVVSVGTNSSQRGE